MRLRVLRRTAVTAVLAALLLTGCGYSPTPVPPTPSTPPPTKPAVAAPATCADATTSYAPTPLPAPGAMPTGSTMATIVERGRLIVGVSSDSLLLGARNPLNGQIEGFDIDLVKAITRALFGDETKVQLRVITAAQRIPVLKKGEVDIVVRNMTMNCDRWKEVAFSAEYYHSGQKILVRRGSTITGLDALAGHTVCAPAGTSSMDNLIRLAPEAIPVTATNHTGCLVRFQKGDADAITGDDTVLAGLAAQDPYAEVLAEPPFTAEPYGVAVKKENVDLVRFINAVLEKTRDDGTWLRSYNRWLAPHLGPQSGPPTFVHGR